MNAREGDVPTRADAPDGRRSPDRSWRLWSAATAAVLLGCVPVLGAAPATAADSGVQLSLDGAHWSPTLAGPLFDAALVPGDVVDALLWVRNASTVTARVSIRAAEGLGTGADDLTGNLTLQVDGAPVTGGATWQGPLLAPGERTVVPLAVAFDADATAGMLGTANVLDTVVLTEDASAATGMAPGPAGGAATVGGAAATGDAFRSEILATTLDMARAGRLAATGTELCVVVGAAVTSLAVGLLFVWRRRRYDDEQEPATSGS